MLIARSTSRKPRPQVEAIARALSSVSTEALRTWVEMISFPRHFTRERSANMRARDLLVETLVRFGYTPQLQGPYDNIIATTPNPDSRSYLLLGAHYDSVPGCPGADDNGSAVAVCVECARILSRGGSPPVAIVFFNREEDGLLGSTDFVAELPRLQLKIAEAHVFEMVGYCSHAAKSQRMPPSLPVPGPTVGDFLGLIANRRSNRIAEKLLRLSSTYLGRFPVLALKIYCGLEKRFADLLRSDHSPFWEVGIPALMWTDTSEFRNANYHRATDTPETLDYEFLTQVTRLTLARALTWA